MKKSYRIADVRFTFEVDFDYKEDKFYDLFRTEDDGQDDFYFRYKKTPGLIKKDDAELIYSNDRFDIYNYRGTEYRCFKEIHDYGTEYVSAVSLNGTKGEFCYTDNYDIGHMLPSSLFVFNNQVMEKMLLLKDAFILHCSFILYNGKAILFSAPSGTGKSTQAALWENYGGALIVNGDRAVVRKTGGVWRAYGLPMCGSSDICLNKSAPIEAVVLLSKAPDNILRRADLKTAIKRMYRECTVNVWDGKAVSRVIEMLTDLYSETTIYTYACTKDSEAVDVLKTEIDHL